MLRVAILGVLSISTWVGAVALAQEEGFDQTDLIDDVKSRQHKPMSPTQATEVQRIGKFLNELYAACGRYPTTQEGLKALVSKPKTLKCEKWGININSETKPYLASVPKGWKYISKDGTAYTVEPLK